MLWLSIETSILKIIFKKDPSDKSYLYVFIANGITT